jgi:hypothetical protein
MTILLTDTAPLRRLARKWSAILKARALLRQARKDFNLEMTRLSQRGLQLRARLR